MIQECYDSLANITKTMQEKTICQIENLKKHNINRNAIITIQQCINDFSNQIETAFHLKDTPLFHNFKKCSMLCSQYTQSNENVNFLYDLQHEISEWLSALRQSIHIEDKKLSLVLIIRDEGNYIEEWLEYHLMLGISHIYIYDNESTDNTREKLAPYIENGQVTYIWWPGQYVQISAYNHAIEHFKYDTLYMGFIDADEFLAPAENINLPTWINEIFEICEKRISVFGVHCGGIGINWKVYGTSHHQKKPKGLVIENYKYRAADSETLNFYIKTICNPRTVQSCNPHHMNYITGFYCTSENGSIILGSQFFDGTHHKLQINHYLTKSEEEYVQRERKGKTVPHIKKPSEEEIQSALQRIRNCYNDVYDPLTEQYVSVTKNRLMKKLN